MRAVLTQDLFNERADKLVITTCADGLFCIPKITEFIHKHGLPAKLTSDFRGMRITIRGGDNLTDALPAIRTFISNQDYKR
tara:strand:+ start:2246 stop:2488 length:243 start_codon:yes stop_codon:yes gene_type:complete